MHCRGCRINCLPASQLIKRTSYRTSACVGAVLLCIGTILSVFVKSATQLIFTFSILQGSGLGILLVSTFSIFAEYFGNRRYFYLNVVFVLVTSLATLIPSSAVFLINYYGIRGTLLLLCAVLLHAIPATLCLHPLRDHTKGKKISVEQPSILTKNEEKSSCLEGVLEQDVNQPPEHVVDTLKTSKLKEWWQYIYKTFDLDLLKDPVFVNVAIGTSLVRAALSMYVSYLPLFLKSVGFIDTDVSILMTILTVSTLIGKTCLCVLTAFMKVKSRYVILLGVIGLTVFQLIQALNSSFWLIAVVCSMVGMFQSSIENSITIVYVEIFPRRFVPAMSLSMTLTALIVFLLGQIISFITTLTDDLRFILILLAITPACCAVSWVIEMSCDFLKLKCRRK